MEQIDKSVLTDTQSEILDKMEKIKMRDFCIKQGGNCFIWASQGKRGILEYHLPTHKDFMLFMDVVGETLHKLYEGKFRMIITTPEKHEKFLKFIEDDV